jgi:hypothetical protein
MRGTEMTNEIKIDSILQQGPNARLRYLGEGRAAVEMLYKSGQWKVYPGRESVSLTLEQITRWIELSKEEVA